MLGELGEYHRSGREGERRQVEGWLRGLLRLEPAGGGGAGGSVQGSFSLEKAAGGAGGDVGGEVGEAGGEAGGEASEGTSEEVSGAASVGVGVEPIGGQDVEPSVEAGGVLGVGLEARGTGRGSGWSLAGGHHPRGGTRYPVLAPSCSWYPVRYGSRGSS